MPMRLAKLKEPASSTAPIKRLIPRIGDRYLAMVRELERTAGRDPRRARLALFDALDEPITLHPEDGVLVAEIAAGQQRHLIRSTGTLLAARDRDHRRARQLDPARAPRDAGNVQAAATRD